MLKGVLQLVPRSITRGKGKAKDDGDLVVDMQRHHFIFDAGSIGD